MITDIITIEAITVMRDLGQAEIKFRRTVKDGETILVENAVHYHGYTAETKGDFIAEVENAAYGGKEGDSAPYLQALGW